MMAMDMRMAMGIPRLCTDNGKSKDDGLGFSWGGVGSLHRYDMGFDGGLL